MPFCRPQYTHCLLYTSIDKWALPGGFINIKESAYEAACRELKEETGLTDIYLEQLYTMSLSLIHI